MDYSARAKEISYRSRINIIEIVYRAKGGHLGGSLSVVDILSSCYSMKEKLPFELILSKGHCMLAWLCVLHEVGKVSKAELDSYYVDGSIFGGHPKRGVVDEISWATGSLGHGLSVCCGKAMARPDKKFICILGDGETNEGSVWEGLMFLSQHKINNVLVIIDNNRQESLDLTDNILSIEDLGKRLGGFQLNIARINGHNFKSLVSNIELSLRDEVTKPSVIIADTVKGKGVSFMEGDPKWHHRKLKDDERDLAITEIEESAA
jgi:transketolase